MHYLGLRSTEDHAHDIEPVYVTRPVEAAHPVTSRFGHLTLFPPMHGAQRPPKGSRNASLHFDESHHPSLTLARELGNQIDVTMSASKPPVYNCPASRSEPPFGDPLPALSEQLTCCEHGVNVARLMQAEASVGHAGNRYPAVTELQASSYLGPQILSRSSRPARTSRGLEPSGGPSIPAA
jgi:hypothetical protein